MSADIDSIRERAILYISKYKGSIYSLSKDLEMSESTLGRIKNGSSMPNYTNSKKIIDFFESKNTIIDTDNDSTTTSEIRLLGLLLEEKDKRIKELEERIEELKDRLNMQEIKGKSAHEGDVSVVAVG